MKKCVRGSCQISERMVKLKDKPSNISLIVVYTAQIIYEENEKIYSVIDNASAKSKLQDVTIVMGDCMPKSSKTVKWLVNSD